MRKWREWATDAEVPQSARAKAWSPSKQCFLDALKKTKGAAGMAGWTADEIKLLMVASPLMLDELYDARCTTTKHAVDGRSQMGRAR